MAEVIQFDDFRDFAKSNSSLIDENPMLNHHLFQSFKNVLRGKVPVYKFFNIKANSYKIAALHIENEFLVYGNGYDNEMIALLDTKIDFTNFKKFTFAGNREIIDALFKPYHFSTEVLKHRIIYKCAEVINRKYSPGQLEVAEPYHLEELGRYGVEFSKEYYGADVKTLEEMQKDTFGSIMAGHMYIWVDEGKIVSMAQTMLEDQDFPVIGFFYTPPAYRSKGYGTSTVHRVTKGLLEAGNEYVMLAADALNPASNRAFQKVGYKSVGEYIRVFKEKK
jgi:RimJ/RimL family protein N-acetyltransferase